jgi:predicted RecB family nuclease
MSEKERKKFNSKGIFTVTQLSYTFRPRRRPKRMRDKREKYHHSLKALAIREKKIHIVGSPELKIEGTPVYLDVEGLSDRDFYYLIGVGIGNGESALQHSLWADTVEDEGKIWREFLGSLETVEKPVLIHYGSYEAIFLRRMSERHGKPLSNSPLIQTLENPVNLLSVIYAQIYFPVRVNSLKELASCVGFKWSETEPSGTKAINLAHADDDGERFGYRPDARDDHRVAARDGGEVFVLQRDIVNRVLRLGNGRCRLDGEADDEFRAGLKVINETGVSAGGGLAAGLLSGTTAPVT